MVKHIQATRRQQLYYLSANITTHIFFYKQHFYKQRQAEIGKKSSKC